MGGRELVSLSTQDLESACELPHSVPIYCYHDISAFVCTDKGRG